MKISTSDDNKIYHTMLEDDPALAGTPPKRGIYFLLLRTKSTEPIFFSFAPL
mgnify:CR=1 FL=1